VFVRAARAGRICYFCCVASGKEQRTQIAFDDDLASAVLVTEHLGTGEELTTLVGHTEAAITSA
jgi:hypothetical protein